MTITTRVLPRPISTAARTGKPVIIEWKKCKMVRNQSIRSAVDEIVKTSSRLGFTKINIIGGSGTGKSSLSATLAHLIHEMADVPYSVRFFQKEDLLDFTATIKTLTDNPQILIFDDLSYLAASFGKNQIEKLKAEITTVRHIDEKSDRPIIIIMNFHAQKALDKFLRIANFAFYSSCSQEEIGYLQELLGQRYTSKIELFKKLRIQATGSGKFTFPLGRKHSFTYKAFEPFLPFLFSNGDTTRFVVSPLRTWIQPLCQTCIPARQTVKTKINLKEFIDDYNTKFTIGNAKTAVKIKLYQNGINVFSKRISQAMKYIDQYLEKREINLEDLANAYELTPTKGLLFPDKKPNV
jgi:energy-coupling factor transporter ATP-binding protein EcfA2